MFVYLMHRYDTTKPIESVDDNYVQTFHINVLHDIRSENDNDDVDDDDDDSVEINLSYVNAIAGDKYNSHFVLVVERAVTANRSDTWTRRIFAHFWQKDVYNVLIVFGQHITDVDGNGDGDVQLRVLTFDPFRSEIDDGRIELGTQSVRYGQLFWDKATNLNGSPLRVSLFGEETRAKFDAAGHLAGGTDALLTQLVAQRMNATLVVIPPSDGYDIGEFLANGGATGSLAQVLDGSVHISFNTRFLRLSQFKGRAQITFTNGRDDICFVVPTAGFASNIYNIVRAFSPSVWYATLAALVSVPMAFGVLYRLQPESMPSRPVFLDFYSWHLAQPLLRLPDSLATKLLIAFWIVYCLLITSSFEGNLTSNLVLRPTLPEINTIRQLDTASTLQIMTFGRYVHLLVQFLNSTSDYKRLPHSIRSVRTSAEMERLINEHNLDYAYANKQHINAYLTRRKGNIVDNRPVFHNVRECPVPFLVAYALRIGSPYLGRINVLLRRAQENGLIALWDGQAEETAGGKGGGAGGGGGGGPVPLTLDHMQSAFYILCMGLAIASLGMLAELWQYRRTVAMNMPHQSGRRRWRCRWRSVGDTT